MAAKNGTWQKDQTGNYPQYAEEYLQTVEGKISARTSEGAPRFSDPKYIGKLCLDKTNLFRRENNLPPLAWNDSLFEIARADAQDMANGTKPFSHEGFEDRVSRYSFAYRTAAENLAWSEGVSHPAELAVASWITSPGHKKNLVGNSELCAIGVAMDEGQFYFVQLFAGYTGLV